MKRYKIITIALILLLLTATILGGCEAEPEEVAEEYDFSVFLGSLDEPIEIDALITEYEESSSLNIEAIIIPENKDTPDTLKNLLKADNSPAVFAVANDVDQQELIDGGYIRENDTAVPYFMNGYGYTYDRAMFNEMFGEKVATQLIKDLRASTYEEWTVFVSALNDFIKDRDNSSFSIQGHSYEFPNKKGKTTENLNGVFAFPGANSDIYGYSVMDIVAQSADLNAWETTGSQSSSAAIEVMNPTLTTYINGLDLITSNLAGKYSSGIRGTDFTNDNYYSNYIANDIFMSGKGMFALIGSTKYSEIQTLNAEKAETLEFLPVKMPYDESVGEKTSEGAIINSSIPAEVSYSLYVNRTLSEDIQKEAEKFLTWFSSHEDQWSDPLNLSIKSYVAEGNTLIYDFEPTELRKWEKIIFADDGIRKYLQKELWNDDIKNEMKAFMTEKWNER